MNNRKKAKKLFLISYISFFVMSLTILFMPLASSVSNSTNKISLIIVGSVFWLSLVVGICITILLSRTRKEYWKKNHITRQKKRIVRSNIISTIALIVGVISLLIFLALIISHNYYSYFLIVLLFLMVFSLCTFCLFNGKNFIYIRQLREEN